MKNFLCFFILLVFASLMCFANPGRDRVKIAHGTIVTDKGTLLRGCYFNPDYARATSDLINSVKNYGLNTVHLYCNNQSYGGPADSAYIDSVVKWTEEDSL